MLFTSPYFDSRCPYSRIPASGHETTRSFGRHIQVSLPLPSPTSLEQKMFQDVALGSVGFRSKCTKKTADAMTSTDAITCAESTTDPLYSFVDGATQTDPKATTTSKSKGKNDAESDEATTQTLEFLQRVGPRMLREMAKNAATSTYFGGMAVSTLPPQHSIATCAYQSAPDPMPHMYAPCRL